MTTRQSTRTMALVALAAAVAASAASSASARPDPDTGAGTWSTASDRAGAGTVKARPTGPAEHATLRPVGSATETVRHAAPPTRKVAIAALAPSQEGFDWLSAGIGATGMAVVVVLAAGIVAMRRGRPGVGSSAA